MSSLFLCIHDHFNLVPFNQHTVEIKGLTLNKKTGRICGHLACPLILLLVLFVSGFIYLAVYFFAYFIK